MLLLCSLVEHKILMLTLWPLWLGLWVIGLGQELFLILLFSLFLQMLLLFFVSLIAVFQLVLNEMCMISWRKWGWDNRKYFKRIKRNNGCRREMELPRSSYKTSSKEEGQWKPYKKRDGDTVVRCFYTAETKSHNNLLLEKRICMSWYMLFYLAKYNIKTEVEKSFWKRFQKVKICGELTMTKTFGPNLIAIGKN
jgi:hypothetical protein